MELAALNCNTFPLLRLFPLEVVQYYSASSSLVQRKPVSRKKADDVVQIFDYTGYYQKAIQKQNVFTENEYHWNLLYQGESHLSSCLVAFLKDKTGSRFTLLISPLKMLVGTTAEYYRTSLNSFDQFYSDDLSFCGTIKLLLLLSRESAQFRAFAACYRNEGVQCILEKLWRCVVGKW